MKDGSDNTSAASRLLKAVARELRDLAHDTARFGESLSGHGRIALHDGSVRLLQKFDMFAQSLQAHAVLIDDLSGRLGRGPLGDAQLDELLHHVPFFGVRERLRAGACGAAVGTIDLYRAESEHSDDFWFLNE